MYVWSTALRPVDRLSRTHRSQTMNTDIRLREHTSLPSEDDAFKQFQHHIAIEATELEEEGEEGSQRSLSGSPGPAAAALAIEGEEALVVHRPQLVLEGVG